MSERVKTNPHLRIRPHTYLDESAFVATDLVTNYSSRIRDVRTVLILETATEFCHRDELREYVRRVFDVDDSREVVESLLEHNLLVREDSPHTEAERDCRRWTYEGWGPAFEFALATRDSLSDKGSVSDTSPGVEKMQNSSIPLYKEYPGAETVELPDPNARPFDTSIAVTLSDGRVEKEPTPLTRPLLSSLLYLAFGQIGEVWFDDIGPYDDVGPFVKKTSPSGGSWHPTEVYLFTNGVDRIPDDLYHYSVKSHHLERLSTVDGGGRITMDDVQSSLPDVSEDPTVTIFYTSRVERNMVKYKDSHIFRVLQQDVGHLSETLRLLCRSEGRRITVDSNCDFEAVEKLLGVDHLEEPIFGYAQIW